MKLFECQNCGKSLYFENTSCESCGLRLGYLPELEIVTALEVIGGGLWRALAERQGLYRLCTNAQHNVCNWLVASDHPEVFCAACRHNRTIPDLPTGEPRSLAQDRVAKHRLVYTLLQLRLPLSTRTEDPNGLAFDFLSEPADASMGGIAGR